MVKGSQSSVRWSCWQVTAYKFLGCSVSLGGEIMCKGKEGTPDGYQEFISLPFNLKYIHVHALNTMIFIFSSIEWDKLQLLSMV